MNEYANVIIYLSAILTKSRTFVTETKGEGTIYRYANIWNTAKQNNLHIYIPVNVAANATP